MAVSEDVTHISGNASYEIKRVVRNPAAFFSYHGLEFKQPTFGERIMEKLVATEVSINKKAEEPEKLEGRYVCEVTVDEDMVNGGGNVHGGCSAFLIDICTTMALTALSMTKTNDTYVSVSQSLNLVYHSPAGLGDRLRIVSTSMTLGARAQSARSEIWNVTYHRLVASGVHIKMDSSVPKSNL